MPNLIRGKYVDVQFSSSHLLNNKLLHPTDTWARRPIKLYEFVCRFYACAYHPLFVSVVSEGVTHITPRSVLIEEGCCWCSTTTEWFHKSGSHTYHCDIYIIVCVVHKYGLEWRTGWGVAWAVDAPFGRAAIAIVDADTTPLFNTLSSTQTQRELAVKWLRAICGLTHTNNK